MLAYRSWPAVSQIFFLGGGGDFWIFAFSSSKCMPTDKNGVLGGGEGVGGKWRDTVVSIEGAQPCVLLQLRLRLREKRITDREEGYRYNMYFEVQHVKEGNGLARLQYRTPQVDLSHPVSEI